VSGLWLLHGSPRATLTTIDSEPEHLGAARQAFADARVPAARARFITGRAAQVLPRMNEASYDIVFVDADPEGVIEYVEHGLRLVRAGGTVLVPRVLGGGAVSDPVRRDPTTAAYRSLILGLSIVHRDDQTAPTLEWNTHDDEAPLLHGLHRPVSGSRLHRCHRGSLSCGGLPPEFIVHTRPSTEMCRQGMRQNVFPSVYML
jgi:hypothetical protein